MRFYVPEINEKHPELVDSAHTHAAYALRIRVDDYIKIFDGKGKEYSCIVKEIKKDHTILEISDITENTGETKTDLTLYLSVIKQDRFEVAVQKATELGVNRIVPVYSAYTQRSTSLNLDRLNKIAISACEQCGRSRLPIIEPCIEFDELVSRTSDMYLIFPWERELHGTIKKAIDKKQPSVAVFIGPEGGITEPEKIRLVEAGAKSVTLGRRILRAETAAISALSVICYEMGEWNL